MRKLLLLVTMIVLTLSACGSRTASSTGKDSISDKEATPQAAPLPSEADVSGSPMVVTETGADAPAATLKTPAVRAVVVQPSRSLAGHDRFLVSSPFGVARPSDFELGPLLDRTIVPSSITPLLDGLAQALAGKNLETADFSSQGLMMARLLYDPDLDSAPAITKVRFSELIRMPGTSYAVALRLFSGLAYAEGLAILGTDDDGNWLIEQLDLELEGLDEPVTRSKAWDPYGYSRNLME
jgi:hypothetical protein